MGSTVWSTPPGRWRCEDIDMNLEKSSCMYGHKHMHMHIYIYISYLCNELMYVCMYLCNKHIYIYIYMHIHVCMHVPCFLDSTVSVDEVRRPPELTQRYVAAERLCFSQHSAPLHEATHAAAGSTRNASQNEARASQLEPKSPQLEATLGLRAVRSNAGACS